MIATLDPPTLALATTTTPRNTILQGDALMVLRRLPSRSVQCVVTSPPYWGLRDYGVAGQLGLEPTPSLYVEHMVAIFDEVRRVLRNDGTCWLNLGDSYASNGTSGLNEGFRERGNAYGHGGGVKPLDGGNKAAKRVPTGLKPKDLVGMPWRIAFALQAAGWYLRSDVIWNKPNPMPESVTDRPTRSHEYIFLLTRSERYYYDADGIREPHTTLGRPPGNHSRIYFDRDPEHHNGEKRRPEQAKSFHEVGRNKRTVWTIATAPFPAAHFATFPPALVTPCILAGSSPMACEQCGAPWERQTTSTTRFEGGSGRAGRTAEDANANGKWAGKQYGKNIKLGPVVSTRTTGWRPTCRCGKGNTGSGHSLVLDPFMGAGTVGLVARQAGRDYLGIELNEQYIEMAERRIAANGRMGKRQEPAPEGQRTLWEVTS